MQRMAPGPDSVKLIILDRDGVVNEDSDDYIKSADEWIPIPGSIEAIAALHKAGFIVVIATNQSGIARKYFDEFDLSAMHQKMSTLVEEAGGQVSGVFFCPHGPDDECDCRKPRTGLLKQIECEFGTSVAGAPFVGDSEKDILAARLAGCRPVLVQTGKGARTALELAPGELSDLAIFPDLATYVASLLREQ
jgi:D-glycero-D-manno-heptose 1,7-bisphosphate phosphatase